MSEPEFKMQDSKFSKKKLIKRLGLGFTIIFFIAIVFFLLRGPYLSNSIKRIIQPALEDAIGERIIIDKAVINLFPFYLQTKGFKIFDKEGNRLLWITKMRVYVDLSGLLSKEIKIKLLTVKEPNLTMDKKMLAKIIETFKGFTASGKGDNFSISLKRAKITEGEFVLTDDERQIVAAGKDFYAEVVARDSINIELSLKDGNLRVPDLPAFNAGVKGKLKVKDRKIRIINVSVSSLGSTLETEGEVDVSSEGAIEHGEFSGSANILMETICRIFGLKKERNGTLSLSGTVDLIPPEDRQGSPSVPRFRVALKASGWFYLQTLMELLKVDEHITGRIAFNGEIKGLYPEFKGDGEVKLEQAELDRLPIDKLKGKIHYEDKKISLRGFTANVYGGQLEGGAFILVPSGEYYVDAKVFNVNSPQFFKFIKWEPSFPAGRVSGEFKLKKEPNKDLGLIAEAQYLNTSENKNNLLVDRLTNIDAVIELNENILRFNKAILYTSASSLFLDGKIDLAKEELDLNVRLESNDLADLTAPYFYGVRAPVTFRGKTAGHSNDPRISGLAEAGPGTIKGKSFDKISGDLVYSPKSLNVELLKAVKGESVYEISGSIVFRQTTGLFSFKAPFYKARAKIKNGDAGSLIAASYKEIPLSGSVNGHLSFEGDMEKYRGSADLILGNGVVFSQPVDKAIIKAELLPGGITFPSIEIHKNNSKVDAIGTVYFDERFETSITSDRFDLKDMVFAGKYPLDANLTFNVNGYGTFSNPQIQFSSEILKSHFKGVFAGGGHIKGRLKGRELSAEGEFLEGIAFAEAKASLTEALPWTLRFKLKKGSYDFLLAAFLKDIPKDFSTSLEGNIELKGEKNRYSMSSKFSLLSFSLYGYSFHNKEDIVFELIDDTFTINSFSISGRNGDITAAGSVKIGQKYDLTLNGRIDMTPLKAVTRSIESLKGRSDFSIEILGPWNSPVLKGSVKVRDTLLMLAGLPHKIGPINGDIFFSEDRITLDSFDADFGGGRVFMSGVGYLERFSLKRLFISSEIKDVRLRPAEDVDVAFDGKLFFETSPKKQNLIGDIKIKKAKYGKRVEWKSWLLSLKEAQETTLRQPLFFSKTALNVHITGHDNILIDNNIARMPVKIDINLQGTPLQYGLIGRVEAESGTFFFRNNEFEIIELSVDFVEPNKVVPVFHILAETFTGGYRVRLNLDGPVERFDLSLFSDPPLSDVDILTLLTSGHVSKEAKGFESGIGAGEAAAFLTGRVQDVMEERFKYITGFERFEISPKTTTTGAVSPMITVGKRLLDQKIFVTYSTSVGTTEEHIIKIQYDLSRNFSIIGQRDEIGSVGGDVKFRFEFK